jgi:cytochrome c oxidase assembly factor CtaG
VLLGVLAVALETPALELSLRGELTHLALSLAPLLAGLGVALSLTPERGHERVRPPTSLLALAALLGWYGVRMWSTSSPAAGGWYDDLTLWWSDPAVDQRLAGVVVVGAALAVAVGGRVAVRRCGPARPARPARRRRPWGARS